MSYAPKMSIKPGQPQLVRVGEPQPTPAAQQGGADAQVPSGTIADLGDAPHNQCGDCGTEFPNPESQGGGAGLSELQKLPVPHSVLLWETGTLPIVILEESKKIIIKPAVVGDLTWVKCGYDSVHGNIVSNWKLEGTKLTMDVTIPINTTATIYVPAKDAAGVTESGSPPRKRKACSSYAWRTARRYMKSGRVAINSDRFCEMVKTAVKRLAALPETTKGDYEESNYECGVGVLSLFRHCAGRKG